MTGLIGRKVGMTQSLQRRRQRDSRDRRRNGSLRRGTKNKRRRMGTTRSRSVSAPVRRSESTKPPRAIWPKPARELSKSSESFVDDDVAPFEIGQEIKAGDLFKVGDRIDVSGISEGTAFPASSSCWSFAGFPGSHGTHEYFSPRRIDRQPVVSCRVRKGKKMAGHWGNEQISDAEFEVVDIRSEENLMLVRAPYLERNAVL